MRAFLLAGVAVLVGVPAAAWGDEPTTAARRKFAELKKKFEAEEKDLKKKLADATDPDEKKQAQFGLKELSAITASDAVELAADNPKDESSVDAAVFALTLLGKFGVTGRDMDKAASLLLDNHVNSPKLATALGPMSQAGPAGERFIKTVAEKTTVKEVQAVASYYTALMLDAQAAEREGGNPEAAAKMRAEAIEMIEKAVKLAPDAKVGETTLAKAAAVEMVAMRIGVGNPIPDVEGIDLDGKKMKLGGYKGKVVLLDFWATWCGPCRAMIPHERELAEKMSKKPFVILSVSGDEQKSELTEFLGNEKMPWAHWWDGARGPLGKTFRVRAFPTLYLIDAKGVVRKKWVGKPDEEELDKAVAALVAEAEKK